MPTVLIIDDHPAIPQLVRTMLPAHTGWEVMSAPDGTQGWEVLRQQYATFDAVLLDIFLPGMDGRRVYDLLHDLAPTLPVIGISADAAALTDLATAGCFAVLPKPLQRAALLTTLERARTQHPPSPPRTPATMAPTVAFDQHPVVGTQLHDLDLGAVEHHLLQAVAHRAYDGPTDPVTFLLAHGGAVRTGGQIVPTYAGILLFAAHPERWVPGSGIDIAHFHTDTPSVDTMRFRQHVHGPIPSVVTRVLEVLWALSAHTYHLVDDLERIELHAYPRPVLRELTLNALSHRDWSLTTAPVQIRVFPTRIEWITPGGLPVGVTVETLREAQVARNPALTTLLYQAGYIEQYGLGMDMVYQVLATHDYAPPSAHNTTGWFSFHVFGHSPDTLLSPPSTDDGLSSRQQHILQVLHARGPLRARELAAAIGAAPRSVQRDLTSLVQRGVVEATGDSRARCYQVPSAR